MVAANNKGISYFSPTRVLDNFSDFIESNELEEIVELEDGLDRRRGAREVAV